MAKPEASSAAEDDRKVREQQVIGFQKQLGVGETNPESFETKDFYPEVVSGILKVDRIQHGKISCFVTVKLLVTNFYGGLHGGAVAVVAEKVSEACARTVMAADKEIFLGESGLSYLTAAPMNLVVQKSTK